MAKIILEENKVKEYVLPNIEKVQNKLKEVNSYAKKVNSSLPKSSSLNIVSNLNKITKQVSSVEGQLSKTKQIILEKVEKIRRIESKSKNKINDISSSIVKAATTVATTAKKTTTSKKESKLVAKLLQQAKLKKVKTPAKITSIIKKNFPTIQTTKTGSGIAGSVSTGVIAMAKRINVISTTTGKKVSSGILSGAAAAIGATAGINETSTIANGIFSGISGVLSGLGLKKDKTPEGQLKKLISRNAKSSKSIEELVLKLNEINYISDEEAEKRKKKKSFWLDIFQPSSKITIDGNTYVFKNGKCCRIEYATGIVARITYDENGIKKVKNNYSGEPSNVDIFGEYNVDNEQYGGNQSSMRNNVDKWLEDPIVLNILNKAYPGKEVENYQKFLKQYGHPTFITRFFEGYMSDETFKKKYGFPKEFLKRNYSTSEAVKASTQHSLEDFELYLKKISSSGCGYTAIINTLFKEYEGREKEFEKKFGYPMYTTKADGTIDYNYEYAIIDTFTEVWKDEGYTLEEITADMKTATGEDASITGEVSEVSTGTNRKVVNQIEDVFEDKYNLDTDMDRITIYDSDDDPKSERKSAIKQIKEMVNAAEKEESEYVILATAGYDLYSMDGELCYEDGGGHAMYITEVTEDGKIIVSSWGKQYIVDLNNADRIGYYTIKYN